MQLLTYKIPLQYEVFKKSFKPTKEEIEKAYYKTGLSDYEIMLIHAFALKQAIERLNTMQKLTPLQEYRINHEYYWLKSWEEHLTFENYSKAVNHLVEVCSYWAEINWKYPQEWMLDAEQIVYERLLDFLFEGKRTSKEQNKSYDDIKQRIGDI